MSLVLSVPFRWMFGDVRGCALDNRPAKRVRAAFLLTNYGVVRRSAASYEDKRRGRRSDFESAASASSAIPAWVGTSVWHRPAGACHWPLFRAARRFFQHQAAEQQREGEERERNESG